MFLSLKFVVVDLRPSRYDNEVSDESCGDEDKENDSVAPNRHRLTFRIIPRQLKSMPSCLSS